MGEPHTVILISNSLFSGATMKLPVACSLCFLITTNVAVAQNLDFETGDFTDWAVSDAFRGTVGGSGDGVDIVTGMTVDVGGGGADLEGTVDYTWDASPFGDYMALLQPGAKSFDEMATALQLSAASKTAIETELAFQAADTGYGSGNPTNAAWISIPLSFDAGDFLEMSWNYIATDYVPFNDGSITTLVNTSNSSENAVINGYTQQFALLAFTNQGTGDYSTGSYGSSGWQIAQYEIVSAGDYLLGFATFNLDDTILSPILLVDSAPGSITQNGTAFDPVPPNPGTNAPVTPPSGGGNPTKDYEMLFNVIQHSAVDNGEVQVINRTQLTRYFDVFTDGSSVIADEDRTLLEPYVGRVDQGEVLYSAFDRHNLGFADGVEIARINSDNGNSLIYQIGLNADADERGNVRFGFARATTSNDTGKMDTSLVSFGLERHFDPVILRGSINRSTSSVSYERTIGHFANSGNYEFSDNWFEVEIEANTGSLRPIIGIVSGDRSTDGYTESGSRVSAITRSKVDEGYNWAKFGLVYDLPVGTISFARTTDSHTRFAIGLDHDFNNGSHVFLDAHRFENNDIRGQGLSAGLSFRF